MLREWLITEHIGGPLGLGNPDVSGFFIDDFWCSDELNAASGDGPCIEQGASEINKFQQTDMGLSDADVKAITLGWQQTMGAVQNYILQKVRGARLLLRTVFHPLPLNEL